ncbi:MAG: DHH family phosphoesterase, partial [Planctomycetes bacterium]|nr:DHH family phosphoesterase [Planctomycetota bacterium]
MAGRRSTKFARPKQVTLIGDNSQIAVLRDMFTSGKIHVNIFTTSTSIQKENAKIKDCECALFKSYRAAPHDLSDGPYFICHDKVDTVRSIKSWLPDTLAVFHLGKENKGRTSAAGFLTLAEPQSATRRNIIRRLGVLKRLDRLRDIARNSELPVILMYGDPDPDAFGSALALAQIWRSVGASPIIRYTGEIQRYQNKLLINYVKEPIDRLRESERLGADVVAVVDAQPGFWKENPPKAHVIIDHHPKLEDTNALFVDLREHYGSTATIMTEYLIEGNYSISRKLATA